MTYSGEHSLPGTIGHLMVVLSFVTAAFSCFSYWRSSNSTDLILAATWKKYARVSFFSHVVTTLTFIFMVLYLIVQHYFEYKYILEHSNRIMDLRYLLVCFWSGQEGSFMLWIFWLVVLGSILVFTTKKWESPFMTIYMLVQVFLVSMLLGVYIGDLKIGSSPFALMREADENFGPLWSLIPEYLKFDPVFADGRGLNPLLQNYWMTIHPPTLFLGFSLTLIPFCYAIAALWKKNYQEWIKPALPWTFFGIAVLGTGILMGGAWAYESLSFGGFWAWDPVENASLVPWLTLVGSGHLLLLNTNKSRSIFSAFFFTLITFILILYSTFLTRSGVLGETSVHSFTGEDMLGQLLLCLMFFIVLSFTLLMTVKKERNTYLIFTGALFLIDLLCWNKLDNVLLQQGSFTLTIRALIALIFTTVTIVFLIRAYMLGFSKQSDEDEITSREFWMFIGALVLLMSSFHIMLVTSIPVGKLLFNSNSLVPPDDVVTFYNRWQTPFAIVVCLLMGFAQYLKYKKTPVKNILKDQAISITLALITTFIIAQFFTFKYNSITLPLMLFAGLYAVFANLDYYVRILKGKTRSLGPAIAHTGFGLVMLGTLISQGEQETLSKNYKGYSIDLLDDEGGISSNKDIQLFKGDTTALGDYYVLYKTKKRENINLYFNIDYFERIPRIYAPGTIRKFASEVFECVIKHSASENFILDKKNWKVATGITPEIYFNTPVWESGKPGKKLFALTPFIQMNPMQKVAEPGTKHFFTYDIFTHIKYAELTGPNDVWMDPIQIKGLPGDTLWTAGYRIILSDAATIDTSGFEITQLKVTILDHHDRNKKYGISTYLHYAKDSTGKIVNPFTEIKGATLKFRLDKPVEKLAGHSHEEVSKYELTFLTREYLILHAIRFPFISILWIGCFLVAIGTLWAVTQRLLRNKRNG
ncbi:MAG: cytochrome c biogenesis protein CcsA [Flavobacteriales bacterium]